MLKAQQDYLNFLSAVDQLLKSKGDLPMPEESASLFKTVVEMQQTIRDRELLIPVVGAFSAGKSSLLNAIVGADWLPVAITPETAIPTELRYDSRERIEALLSNDRTEECGLADLPKLQARAQEIELVRLYANRPSLQKLHPLVLVDMPGFNSPRDAHNAAIVKYIDRGAHYLFVVSVEEGTLTKQLLNEIQNVVTLGRNFSVCVNKADLRPASEVDEIRQYIVNQLQESGLESQVCTISQHDVQSVRNALAAIDPEGLIRQLFRTPLQQIYQSAQAMLQTMIDALGRDHQSNAQAVAELQAAVQELEAQRNAKLQDTRKQDQSTGVEEVLGCVTQRLEWALDELARAALRGPEDIKRIVSDEVRSGLVTGLKRVTDEMSAQTVSEFSQLSAAGVSPNLQISESWSATLLKTLQADLLPMLLSSLATKAGTTVVLGGGLGTLLNLIPVPIIKIASLIIGPLIGHLLGQAGEEQKQEKAKDAIRSQLIPAVVRGLRPEVEKFLTTAQEHTIEAVAKAFEQQINAQRAALNKANESMQRANAQGLRDTALALRNEIQALAHAHHLIDGASS